MTPSLSPPVKSPSQSTLVHLKHDHFEVDVEISGDGGRLISSLSHEFSRDVVSSFEDGQLSCSAELLLHFLKLVATKSKDASSEISNGGDEIVRQLWDHLEKTILRGNDIHVYAAALPSEEDSRKLLAVYFSAVDTVGLLPRNQRSALLRAQDEGRTCIYGIFGGQGNSQNYFQELQQAYSSYKSFVKSLILASSELLAALSHDSRVSKHFSEGLNVLEWLEHPETTPSSDYLISAPLSFPIIGLLQLTYVEAICRCIGGASGAFPSFFRGLLGHSQGVVVAACLSTVTTWEDFRTATQKALKILFWIGTRSQEVFDDEPLPPSMTAEALKAGYGLPSPMLSISNMPLKPLEKVIEGINQHRPRSRRVFLSLINGERNFVVSGSLQSLSTLATTLRSQAATEDQSRVPFSKRKFTPSIRFLPVSAPFHCELLEKAVSIIESDLSDVQIDPSALGLSINSGSDGVNLNSQAALDIVPILVRAVTCEPVNWHNAAFPDATHVIDFGPGGTSGIGIITQRNQLGTDIRVILASVLHTSVSGTGRRAEIFDTRDDSIRFGNRWSQNGCSLIKTTAGTFIDSKLSRLLGLPPMVIAGMTPTTTHPDFVAAAMHAGFHIELACGGYVNAEQMRAALTTLKTSMPSGRGITVNVIYVNPKALTWQIPLIRQLRAEQFPITGMTVGGGIPSLDVASEYVETLGLEHISFKPGSAASIHQVISIAQKYPEFPIILQWTGGRAGGHHSFEDFHAPILETYSNIRNCPNIVLVAGSGFGATDASDSYPYLTGSWAQSFGRKMLMPFDGVLFGSRVMACRETRTGHGTKAAIASAQGLQDRDWELTYSGASGGMVSVISEMGQPIHVVATRGARLWAELDQEIFALDKKKQAVVIHHKRAYIIRKLNEDYQKVWFPSKHGAACELEDMTYSEVLRRMLKLMFVESQQQWIDDTYRQLWLDFVSRVEERFAGPEISTSVVAADDELKTPHQTMDLVLSVYPDARHVPLCLEDVHFLLSICRRPHQKPVPFIPALDEHFETWFKKDSLWQSEHLEAVPDQDAGRTFILLGPVAAQQSSLVDESIKYVMDSINTASIARMLSEMYGDDDTNVPRDEYIRRLMNPNEDHRIEDQVSLIRRESGIGSIDVSSLSGEQILLLLAGRITSWRQAIFMTRDVTQGSDLIGNPVRKMIQSQKIDILEISTDTEDPDRATITLFESRKGEEPKIVIEIEKIGRDISVRPYTWETSTRSPVSLDMKFKYVPEAGYAPIREVIDDRNDRIYDFYRRLWLGTERPMDAVPEDSTQTPDIAVFEDDFEVDEVGVRLFNSATSRQGHRNSNQVKMDLAIVLAWKSIAQALLQEPVQGDLLKLVHLSNSVERTTGSASVQIGDHVHAEAKVASICIDGSGKIVEITAKILRDEAEMLTLVSRFLFRGSFEDFESTFERKDEPDFEVELVSEQDVAVLASKQWFQFSAGMVDLIGATLVFRLETSARYESKSAFSLIKTTGEVLQRCHDGSLQQIGTVNYTSGPTHGNLVTSYLERCGRRVSRVHKLDSPTALTPEEVTVTIPSSNQAYSQASGDFNPIHTSGMFASLVGLPGTITHGMYCSAAVRQVVVEAAANNCEERMRKYEVNFIGMVLPNDVLTVALHHIGMIDGLKVVKVEARKQSTGEKVLEGEALIAQRPSAFLFTGQGSQAKGMGMDLYDTSSVARAVWNQADEYFETQFGLRITDIVRNNPKEIRVHFGGVKGRKLLQNYMSLTYEAPGATEGTFERRRVFPVVSETTRSYTHRSHKGLLFATQFAQPALTVMEIAAFKHMESRGLIDPQVPFAGHSLGEYSALAAITDFMPFERLLFVVFCRGLTMQAAVQRDELGRSSFGMVAIDPSKISKGSLFSVRQTHTQLLTPHQTSPNPSSSTSSKPSPRPRPGSSNSSTSTSALTSTSAPATCAPSTRCSASPTPSSRTRTYSKTTRPSSSP